MQDACCRSNCARSNFCLARAQYLRWPRTIYSPVEPELAALLVRGWETGSGGKAFSMHVWKADSLQFPTLWSVPLLDIHIDGITKVRNARIGLQTPVLIEVA
jgi:hypothetical protein